MKLNEAIKELGEKHGWDILIADNAQTWDLDNLYDAVRNNEDPAEYNVMDDGIYRIQADGLLESIPTYKFID